MIFNTDYLEDKYPNVGYKSAVSIPDSYTFRKPWEKLTEEQINQEVEYNAIKKIPCINVCECGEEWESAYGEYQEGCYPYVATECRSCSLKSEEIRRRKEFEIEQEKRSLNLLKEIPTRYRNVLDEPLHNDLLDSKCAIIWGGFGTGKTHECYSIVKKLLLTDRIKTWKLLTEIDLINYIIDFEYRENRMDILKDIDFLIVDEAGKSNSTDNNNALLFSILNYRYEWEKKTILICNAKDREEVKSLMPSAILDRYREVDIYMGGKSKRYSDL